MSTGYFVLLMAMTLAGWEGIELCRALERVDIFCNKTKKHGRIPLKVHGKYNYLQHIIQAKAKESVKQFHKEKP